MRRLKLAVLSAALLFITTAVFSERASFVPQDVYVDKDGLGTMELIIETTNFPGLTTVSGSRPQASIKSSDNSSDRNLFTKDGSNFIPLYTSGF